MKRVRRLYRLEGLQLRTRLRRRNHMSMHRGTAPAATRAHERWSVDFVHDSLIDGRAFRVLTVVDQWSRWSPILEIGSSMSGQRVAEVLDRMIVAHGTPVSITVDHGKTVVVSRLTGSFPGSPIELRYFFELAGDKIASLQIIARSTTRFLTSVCNRHRALSFCSGVLP